MNDSSQQSGFTLAETVVTLGLLALFAGGVVWMLGSHPGSLARATADFDAALTSARAIAATSGNGATVVFLPRGNPSHALAGFTLRVFSGRPTAASEVRADTVMPVTSDAGVSETTLGSPPFSLFFGASGDVSGASRYPQTDAHGDVRFPAIAIEPPCPRAGFVLTFVSAQHTVTRRLPCASPVAATAAPNPSPTPNVPLITPAQLQYRWPADARQTFVATEWGYTHWFAADGFACGSGVAEFPNVLPSPYSPPYDAHEGDATPPPPPHAPYSYPNSRRSKHERCAGAVPARSGARGPLHCDGGRRLGTARARRGRRHGMAHGVVWRQRVHASLAPHAFAAGDDVSEQRRDGNDRALENLRRATAAGTGRVRRSVFAVSVVCKPAGQDAAFTGSGAGDRRRYADARHTARSEDAMRRRHLRSVRGRARRRRHSV